LTFLFDVSNKKCAMWKKVAKEFFVSNSPADHQIESYNEFMKYKLYHTISNSELVYTKETSTYTLKFDNILIKSPELEESNGVIKKLKPSDCRDRGLTYNCKVVCDIIQHTTVEEKLVKTEVFQQVLLGYIPVMIKSNWCVLNGLSNDKLIEVSESGVKYFEGLLNISKDAATKIKDNRGAVGLATGGACKNSVTFFTNLLQSCEAYFHYLLLPCPACRISFFIFVYSTLQSCRS
jgi:DNA-directed RNA polymerase beta subunit